MWFYDVAGESRKGPVSLVELKGLIRSGAVKGSSQIWAEGMPEPISAEALMNGPAGTSSVVLPWLLPVGRSGLAIAAGYCGLFSFVPLVHVAALVLSILAARDLQRDKFKRGWGRVAVGLLGGVFFTVLYGFVFLRPI